MDPVLDGVRHPTGSTGDEEVHREVAGQPDDAAFLGECECLEVVDRVPLASDRRRDDRLGSILESRDQDRVVVVDDAIGAGV